MLLVIYINHLYIKGTIEKDQYWHTFSTPHNKAFPSSKVNSGCCEPLSKILRMNVHRIEPIPWKSICPGL